MRITVLLVFAVACGTSPGWKTGELAFEITSADATVQPGDQITYCYHFRTPNTSEVLVDKWQSDMTAGSHHAILFLLPGGSDVPDGTLDTAGCNGGADETWTYATQNEHEAMDLPTDDGAGKPLAQKIPPHTAAVIQLHVLNATDTAVAAHIDLQAFALASDTPYTETDVYVAYQYQIDIPAGATGVTVPGACPVPDGAKFWTLSTHAHKQAVATEILDGDNTVFTSTDWEHPGEIDFPTPTRFHSFSDSMLAWQCTYDNTAPPPYCDQGGAQGSCSNADTTVSQGLSAVTDEMCVAFGYFFPATGPKLMVSAGGDNCVAL